MAEGQVVLYECLTSFRQTLLQGARPKLLLLSSELFSNGLIEGTFPLSSRPDLGSAAYSINMLKFLRAQ